MLTHLEKKNIGPSGNFTFMIVKNARPEWEMLKIKKNILIFRKVHVEYLKKT
jgi:hypothetical protein